MERRDRSSPRSVLQAAVHAVRRAAYACGMDLRERPLGTAEFLCVDVETNGLSGDACELTEVGAVLVGGGELHDRYCSLVSVRRPLGRSIQRLTGITQDMVDDAPEPGDVLRRLAGMLDGRVLVAHSASFDRRVLRDACARAEVPWPGGPVLCTVALARRFAPLARQRKLAPLAATLGIDVEVVHRALPDAETCARVFCALFHRLSAHAATVGEAEALLAPRRRRPRTRQPAPVSGRIDFRALPDEPGVYLFRDAAGRVLYVGKSVSLRARAREHFLPSGHAPPAWTAHADSVDCRVTHSELGALVLENRLIKELRPAGNAALKRSGGHVYLRCRLDIDYPILEVARDPAAGRGITVGPLPSRAAAVELVEQLNSLFGLRHCGRRLRRRPWASIYGQMGRCLSPCLNDLDPNLYRRRLDEALALFTGPGDGGDALLEHLEQQMRAAAAELRYERAAWLRRRRDRLEVLLGRLGSVVRATHSLSRLVLAPHPRESRHDAFWLVAGRVADWGPVPPPEEVAERTERALARSPAGPGPPYVPPEEVDELRIVTGWLAAHPDIPVLPLQEAPARQRLEAFLGRSRAA